jgi:hypothetical protein
LTKKQLLAAVNHTVGYAVTGFLSVLSAHHGPSGLGVAVKVGLVMGAVTTIATASTSFIEWMADDLPEKRTVALESADPSFTLQSVQYWVVLLDMSIRSYSS